MCTEVEPLHVAIRIDVAAANVAYDTRTMYARRAGRALRIPGATNAP
jgi:hypothetical protein